MTEEYVVAGEAEMRRSTVLLAGASAGIATVVGVGSTAQADTPIGTCTQSYALYTEAELVAVDPGASAVFGVVDTNHDLVVCFKFYPNGPHAGHGGNLVDDKAAPHS